MPRYQGGKAKIGARIAAVLREAEAAIGRRFGPSPLPYFEPFVGFCGVLVHMAPGRRKVTACDANPDIPELWSAIQRGWIPPPSCTNERRQLLRDGPSCPEKTLVGFGTSFNGSWFLGKSILRSGSRDPAAEAARGALKVGKAIGTVRFLKGRSYSKFAPSGKLVYCDPPYRANNYGQAYFRGFDSDAFWTTMRTWAKDNIVLVSETSAPSDWVEIWSTRASVNVRWKSPKGGKARTCAHKEVQERLYVHRSQASSLTRGVRGRIRRC